MSRDPGRSFHFGEGGEPGFPRAATAGHVLEEVATLRGDAHCLTIVDGVGAGAVLTYAEFASRVRRFAGAMAELGLGPGERLIIHMSNSREFVIAFWAAQHLGAIAVPTIAQYSGEELAYVIGHSEPWGIVTEQGLAGVVSVAARDRPLPIVVARGAAAGTDPGAARAEPAAAVPGTAAGPEMLDFDQLLEAGIAHEAECTAPRGLDLPSALLYTSGTTARPKGALLSQGNVAYAGEALAQHLRLNPDDRVLTCMPLFHANGLLLQMMPAIFTGCPYIVAPKFSVSSYWDWVRDHGVTVGHLVGGLIRLLIQAAPSADDADNPLRLVTYGLPVREEEAEYFDRRFGLTSIMGWGMTETGGVSTFMPVYQGRRGGYQNIGKMLRGTSVAVVDERGERCPNGELGELVVKGPGVIREYFRDPAATAETIVDGWLRSGDLASVDDEGYFTFLDRKKDMLKPSGENVAASEIEDVANEHPAVGECAAVGVPDPIRSEAVKLFVVPVEPGAEVDLEDLLAHCRQRLAAFKVPSLVEVREQLPKTSIGKIMKGRLRAESTGEGS